MPFDTFIKLVVGLAACAGISVVLYIALMIIKFLTHIKDYNE